MFLLFEVIVKIFQDDQFHFIIRVSPQEQVHEVRYKTYTAVLAGVHVMLEYLKGGFRLS